MGQEGLAEDKKNARRRRAWIIFQDESGCSLLPSVRSTWAPRGQTPVLRHHFNWKRLSMAGCLCYRPERSDATLVFAMRAGSYNEDTLIEFLPEVHQELEGDKVTIIWDGLPSHRSKKMKAFIATQRHWLVVEQLPGYAHDINPIEQVWGNLKNTELANLCPESIDEVAQAAGSGLNRIGTDAELCLAFLRHCGLSL